MTLYESLDIIHQLERWGARGGSVYKQVTAVLHSEATTHNMEEARQLLQKLKEKYE